MARRTFDDVTGYILSKLGNRTDATSAMREQWVNDAVLWCANHYEHKELQGKATETLLATEGTLTPAAADLWWPVSLKNMTSGKFLEPDDYENIEEGTKPTSAQGPSDYAWWGGIFYFNSKADTANISIELRYRKLPARWSTGTSPLTEPYDLLIELMGASFGFEHFRLFDLRDQAETRAKRFAREMNLPVLEEKKNDYRAGLRPPRMNWSR